VWRRINGGWGAQRRKICNTRFVERMHMTLPDFSTRARILIRIQELAKRLGALQRQLPAATPGARPVIEIGISAIAHEISELSRMLR
jgi:hypothetical protein